MFDIYCQIELSRHALNGYYDSHFTDKEIELQSSNSHIYITNEWIA